MIRSACTLHYFILWRERKCSSHAKELFPRKVWKLMFDPQSCVYKVVKTSKLPRDFHFLRRYFTTEWWTTKQSSPSESVNGHGYPIAVVRTPWSLTRVAFLSGPMEEFVYWIHECYVLTALCSTSIENLCLNCPSLKKLAHQCPVSVYRERIFIMLLSVWRLPVEIMS